MTRNAETFSQIASRLQDTIFLTEDEMFAVAIKYCETKFSVTKLVHLSPDQKMQLARELHFKYNASNQQLRRLLKLDIQILSEVFPD